MRKKVFEITILDDIICIKTDDFYFAFNEDCTGMQGMTGNQEEALGSKYRELGLLARLIAKNQYSTFHELRSCQKRTKTCSYKKGIVCLEDEDCSDCLHRKAVVENGKESV